jgi:hypothetical protein
MIGLAVPGVTSIAALRSAGQDGKPREEVWGLVWQMLTLGDSDLFHEKK